MALALFDLDNTLLAGDSDHSFGHFLCARGIVDEQTYRAATDRFYADYQAGTLDIDRYLRHALSPFKGKTPAELEPLLDSFLQDWVEPMVLPAALDLIEQHRQQGDVLAIITATNTVVTQPIAERLGIETLIGCEAQLIDGRYSGAPTGIPSFREGKVKRLQAWLKNTGHSIQGAHFYSDSHNDLPLLEQVDNPVAVDPDDQLRAIALTRGWRILSLRS